MSSLQRSKSKAGGGLGRSASRLHRDGDGRRKKDYSDVQQGLKQLYPPGDDSDHHEADLDIVLVPGLGANPEESWKSPKGFNWTTSEEALIKDFPKSRVLLFMYESAWYGALKVKSQVMSNIARTLLVNLQSKRKRCKGRPIVFIGHSMGGLVVANAVTDADQQRQDFPLLFEAITATFFFGTPFHGTEAANLAAMFATVAEKIDAAASSKLLEMMKPGNEALRLLRENFTQATSKLTEPIKVVCFWEQQPTDFTSLPYVPSLMGLTNYALRPRLGELVSRESAILESSKSFGLACNHRNLVKYDGPRDKTWNQTVREQLRDNMNNAGLSAKSRVNLARGLDYTAWRKIAEALGSPQTERKRNQLKNNAVSSRWITETDEFKQWFELGEQNKRHGGLRSPLTPAPSPSAFLWIRGREGRGKTGSVLSALDHIERLTNSEEKNEGSSDSSNAVRLAYFICEGVAEFSTAEDLLKSLIIQLIDQQNMLAAHAKGFIKKKKAKEGSYKSPTQPTVENLWQCLQDMLYEDAGTIGRRVYFVLHNLHALTEDSQSTMKFMEYLKGELNESQGLRSAAEVEKVETRWLVTSRNTHIVSRLLGTTDGVCLVDLEDDKYGDQVQKALQRHAKERVAQLEGGKKYSKALAFFASSVLGRRAQNVHWIDITCVQLEQLPETESHMKIRKILEQTPQDLDKLLRGAWERIFQSVERSGGDVEGLLEMLRALILTFEDPTIEDLGILAGFEEDEGLTAELEGLIDSCSPFLVSDRSGTGTVEFMNPAVKTHLVQNAHDILGLSPEGIKLQHGMLALRSLDHIKKEFGGPESEAGSDSGEQEDHGSDSGSDTSVQDHEDLDTKPDDDDKNSISRSVEESSASEDDTSSSSGSDEEESYEMDGWDDWISEDDGESQGGDYAVQFWLKHASQATADFATDLARESELWTSDSPMRRRWLEKYWVLTGDFSADEAKQLKALHVAASIGFGQLVLALIENGHKDEIHAYDMIGNTPLHLAAQFGQSEVVDVLLDQGADINAVEDEDEDTPLHLAAEEGHIDVVKKLIKRGANKDMYSLYSGLVINAAISSGSFDLVEVLVEANVSLFSDRSDVESPLAQAAAMADPAMLHYLMDKYARFIHPSEYSKARISAAGAGRLDVFKSLLGVGNDADDYQAALDKAAKKGKWEIVTFILERRSGLSCDEAFYEAATGAEVKDEVLEALGEYTNGRISDQRLADSLYKATDLEKESTVKLLLSKFNADPDAKGKEYGDALTASAHDGTINILRALLAANAKVASPDGYAIQIAAAKGHTHIVTELLQHGADVNAVATNEHFPQGTALQGATEAGASRIVELLLAENANPNLGRGENAPPLYGAAVNGEEDIIAMLVDAGADVNVVGGANKSTPLIETVKHVWGKDSLKKLLEARADINATDEDGETVLIAAARTGDVEAVRYLLRRGADVLYTSPSGINALVAGMGVVKPGMEDRDQECMQIIVDHVSCILSAVKQSMLAGNAALTVAVQDAVEDFLAANDEEDEVADVVVLSNDNQEPYPPDTVEVSGVQNRLARQDEQSLQPKAVVFSMEQNAFAQVTDDPRRHAVLTQPDLFRKPHQSSPHQQVTPPPIQRRPVPAIPPPYSQSFSPPPSAGHNNTPSPHHQSAGAHSTYQQSPPRPVPFGPTVQQSPPGPVPSALIPGQSRQHRVESQNQNQNPPVANFPPPNMPYHAERPPPRPYHTDRPPPQPTTGNASWPERPKYDGNSHSRISPPPPAPAYPQLRTWPQVPTTSSFEGSQVPSTTHQRVVPQNALNGHQQSLPPGAVGNRPDPHDARNQGWVSRLMR